MSVQFPNSRVSPQAGYQSTDSKVVDTDSEKDSFNDGIDSRYPQLAFNSVQSGGHKGFGFPAKPTLKSDQLQKALGTVRQYWLGSSRLKALRSQNLSGGRFELGHTSFSKPIPLLRWDANRNTMIVHRSAFDAAKGTAHRDTVIQLAVYEFLIHSQNSDQKHLFDPLPKNVVQRLEQLQEDLGVTLNYRWQNP